MVAAIFPDGGVFLFHFHRIAVTAEKAAYIFGGCGIIHKNMQGRRLFFFQQPAAANDGFGAGKSPAIEFFGHDVYPFYLGDRSEDRDSCYGFAGVGRGIVHTQHEGKLVGGHGPDTAAFGDTKNPVWNHTGSAMKKCPSRRQEQGEDRIR